MQIHVRLFSVLRECAGQGQLELEVPVGCDVGAALRTLARRFPSLEPWVEGTERLPVLCAVNREYAKPGSLLRDGDEVAVFPPVSGGSAAVTAVAESRGLLLLSGGFDSPVAGHLVQAGGRRLAAVHFTMEPFTDNASVAKAQSLAHRLGLAEVTIVPLGEDLAEFVRHCDHHVYFVLLKRLMVRVAEALAPALGATFLVTGENLGQVSSQTLSNLGVIDAAATRPILRPLLGLDKQEILALAKRIQTYETSCGPELCDTLGPKHPATSSTEDRILREEAKVDVPSLVRRAAAKAYVLPAVASTLTETAACK